MKLYFILALLLVVGCSRPKTPTAFDTLDGAAKSALNEVYHKGRQTGWEWGGVIYQTASGHFGYTEPETQRNPTKVGVTKQAPAGSREVALYHNHTSFGGFSTEDKDLYWIFYDFGFVVDPSGAKLKYTTDRAVSANDGQVTSL